jgi:flagellar biosynthesis protein FlhG
MIPQPSVPLHPAARAQNMVTVASGKGGVGKTLLAISIAHAFSKAGQSILLFDGDLGLANIDIQLGIMPEHDLGSVITGRIPVEKAITKFEDGGFDILAGKSGSGALAELSKERLERVRRELMSQAKVYDRVIVDLGAGIQNEARVLAASSGIVLVIATDEPTSLTDAYAFIKVTNAQYPGTDIRILVNMAQSTREGKRTHETLRKACESFLKISPRLAGIVRADPKVKDTIRAQSPLLTRHPNSNAAMDIEAVVKSLLAD